MFQASLQVGKHMSLAGHSPKSTSYHLEPCLEMPGQPAATAQYISIRHLTRIPGTCASPLFKLIHWQQKRKKKNPRSWGALIFILFLWLKGG